MAVGHLTEIWEKLPGGSSAKQRQKVLVFDKNAKQVFTTRRYASAV